MKKNRDLPTEDKKMVKENAKREALKKKMSKEREELSQLHLVTTSEELRQALMSIDSDNLSAAKKRATKISFLKTQMKIRKKVLKQDVPIVFTHYRNQRPLDDIVKELSDFIDRSTASSEFSILIKDPKALVGRQIKQKFQTEEDGRIVWYNGTVVGYCMTLKTHDMVYEGARYVQKPHFSQLWQSIAVLFAIFGNLVQRFPIGEKVSLKLPKLANLCRYTVAIFGKFPEVAFNHIAIFGKLP